MLFHIEMWPIVRKIRGKDSNEALAKFFHTVKVKDLKAMFFVKRLDGDQKLDGKEAGVRLGSTEDALRKLGLLSKYRKEIEKMRSDYKGSKKEFL